MRARRGAAAWLLYIAVRMLFAVLQAFPIEWNLRSARLLAKLWPWIMPRHRKRAIDHLTSALGNDRARSEIDILADRCLESVAMFAVEAVCLPRLINAFTWTRYVRLEKFDDVLELILRNEGVILVTGHYGSFELTGHVLAALGFDVTAVMRPLDNIYLNRFIVQARRTHGLTLLDKKGAMVHSRGILKRGGLLAFIGDQDAGRKGMFVEFFGRAASTYKSIGLLAMWAQCPIVVGYARRRGLCARYDVGVQRIIRPQEWESQSDPLRWITQAYTSAIEAMVRDAPAQYLWIHRRWKSRPQSGSAESTARVPV